MTTSEKTFAGPVRTASVSGIPFLPEPGEHPGFTLARLSAGQVALLAALAALGVHGTPAWLGVALVAAWCVFWAHPLTAAFAGAAAWALETGFGENRLGMLTFAGGDLLRLALLVALTVAVAVITRRRRGRVR